jgi:zinc protease
MATNNQSLPGPHNITRTTLDNGLTVLVYENHAAQSVVIAGSLRSGSIYEDHSRSGLAGITADALMYGTEHHDFDAIHEALESIGADLSVDAGGHKTGFNGKALAEDLPVLIDILGDVLRYPSFPPDQVERLRGEIMVGLQYRQQDTRYRASRAFRENLYPFEHPYHHSTSGTLETVPTITIDEMQTFHGRHYGPDGMILVIVGDVNTQSALDIVRSQLGDWRNPDQPPTPSLPDVPPVDEIRRASVTVKGKTQSDIVMGVPGPARKAEDYQAASLANSILGQFGMMGRIGKEVREKLGLAYYAYSRVEGGFGPNPWSVSAGVNPANVQLATDSIVKEIRRISNEPVSDEDIDDNKSYFTGHLPLQLENNEGIAGTILSMESYELGLDYLLKYRDLIYSLTKDDLLAAAQRYWNPEAFVLAVAGPDEG